MRPVVSHNSHFAKRFAAIVSKVGREDQDREAFHAQICQRRSSVLLAKLWGKMCDSRQTFLAKPSRHADDMQRRRQARNALQPFYYRELAVYKLKGLSGLRGRQTFVAIAANLADKAHGPAGRQSRGRGARKSTRGGTPPGVTPRPLGCSAPEAPPAVMSPE